MRKFIWSAIISLTFSSIQLTYAAISDELIEKMDEVSNSFVENKEFAGIQVVIQDENGKLFHRGYGFSNIEDEVSFVKQTYIAYGSNTKQFTSTAVLLLADQNLLNLDDYVEKYISLKTFKDSEITLRHLLCHTAGIPDSYNIEDKGNVNHLSIQQFSKLLDTLPISSELNEKYQYSNAGYLILGRIVELVSGQSLGDFYRERIVAPLKLEDTVYLGDTFHPLSMSKSYESDFSPFTSEHQYYSEYRISHGAGALGGTLKDMLIWRKKILTENLLSEESLQEKMTACTLKDGSKTNYGLGIKMKDFYGQSAFYHGGAINGFMSDVYYFPKLDISIGFAVNTWTIPVKYRDKLLEVVLEYYIETDD